MYRTDDRGEVREAIPDIARYAVGYRSPKTMDLATVYETELEAEERFAALIRFIAEKQRDGYTYVVSGRWTKKNNPRIPDQWSFGPKPLSDAVKDTENSRWFQPVPAYRIAAFRVAVALTTIGFHVHHFDQYFHEYLRSSFHYPLYPWVPSLTLYVAIPLFFARNVAAWFLLFGFYPRLSAALLAASGFYLILLDGLYFSHNTHLHLLLLVLLACSDDRVNLWRLIQPDEGQAVTLAWPERLVVLQLCIVFFFTALDKIGNPTWGTSGGSDRAARRAGSRPPLRLDARFESDDSAGRFPGVLSVATIILEFIVAVTFLFQPLWRVAIPLVIAFMMWLEFLLEPDLFAWDVTAIMLLLLPAGDRAYTVRCDGESAGGLWMRRIVSRLDWLRRLRWESAELASQEALVLISPTGKHHAASTPLECCCSFCRVRCWPCSSSSASADSEPEFSASYRPPTRSF